MKPYKSLQLLTKVKSLFRFLFDKEVPFYKKTVILFAFGYLLFPFDIIPDPILGLGIIDDITVFLFIFNAFQSQLEKYEKTPSSTVNNKDDIVENVDYTVEDDNEKGE